MKSMQTQHGASTDPPRIRVGVALPVGAGWNGESTVRELASSRGLPTLAQLNDFCLALSVTTGVDAIPHGMAHYGELLDKMVAGELELAWLPPVVALRATASGRTLPITLPVRNGTAYYSTALFTRADSPLMSPRDLAGARAAWVDQQSAAGYLVIRGSLRMRGIDLEQAFGESAFYGSHDAVTRAVLAGSTDVGATYVLLDPRRSTPRRAGWGDAQVRMLATAGPIPADVLAATIRMPVSTIRTLQRALVAPPNEHMKRAAGALFSAEGFIEADSQHLEPLSSLLAHMEDRAERTVLPPLRHGRPGA
jgi:phosphonate transport system substrate-binding protein